jgi:hypothetical protein
MHVLNDAIKAILEEVIGPNPQENCGNDLLTDGSPVNWARSFCKQHPEINEIEMVCWFANAMYCAQGFMLSMLGKESFPEPE